jgi:hypothetical protein
MVFGVILVLMMIFRPAGILPARRRQLEAFHDGDAGGPVLDAPGATGGGAR